jgi:hypothetical protein
VRSEARDGVLARGEGREFRYVEFATLVCLPTPEAEGASAGRCAEVRNARGNADAFAGVPLVGVRNRGGSEQRFGVRVSWVLEDVLCRARFDDAAVLHNGYALRDMAHDREIV